MARSPMVRPGRIVALAPIDAPRFTSVRAYCSGCCPLRGNVVVRKGGVGPDEDVVLKGDAVPQLHPALDGDAVAEADLVLDEGLVADIAVRADHRARQHVGVGPYARARADRGALHDRGLVPVEFASSGNRRLPAAPAALRVTCRSSSVSSSE